MLNGMQNTDRMNSSQRPATLAMDLHYNRFVSHKESKPNYNQLISPTSTLSSGYESGCAESDIDEMLYSSSQQDECEYFELESDQYVCLDQSSDDEDVKLQKVKNSMIKIIEDLESLGYETSLDELTNAVRSSVRLSNSCSKSAAQQSSLAHKKSRKSSHTKHYSQNINNNDVYTKSSVDELFTEIGQYQDSGRKERLYDSLITSLAIECSSTPLDEYSDEPIYEEIFDDSDFDFVSHSDTYRKQNIPPALPPRSTRSLEPQSRRSKFTEQRRTSTPCLTEVQKVTWNSGGCRNSTWHAMSV